MESRTIKSRAAAVYGAAFTGLVMMMAFGPAAAFAASSSAGQYGGAGGDVAGDVASGAAAGSSAGSGAGSDAGLAFTGLDVTTLAVMALSLFAVGFLLNRLVARTHHTAS